MMVIKAGGSVITRKGSDPVFDHVVSARLAKTLSRLNEPFVIVHGSGSFGKPPARRYGYLSGRIRPGTAPLAAIKASLLELHSLFITGLVSGGVNAVSCPGCACFSLDAGRPRLRARGTILDWLVRGFVPVINSDIFPCGGGRFRVISSDALLAELCAELSPELAVFFTDTPGLLDGAGSVIGSLSRAPLLKLRRSVPPSPQDVSGGMRGKMMELALINAGGVDAAILDGRRPGELLKLRGGLRAKGTYIHAPKK